MLGLYLLAGGLILWMIVDTWWAHYRLYRAEKHARGERY